MSTICHFEIPADDVQRAKKFYETVFEWEFKHYPEMDYWGIMTGEEGKSVGGGMMKRQQPQQPIMNYLDVDCVDTFSKKITEAGGKVVMGKSPVPGMGWFAVCLDSENNAFGIFEEDREAK